VLTTLIVSIFITIHFFGIFSFSLTELSLAISLTLATLDTVALVFTIRELREKRSFLEKLASVQGTMEHAVKLIGRHKINRYLAETTEEAEETVHHLSYVFGTPEEDVEIEKLIRAIKQVKQRQNVELLFIGPPLEDKLDGAYLRFKAGAQVKFHPFARGCDCRFHIVDGKKVVIGVATAPSEPSSVGYFIESRTLARILEKEFLSLWNSSECVDFESLAKEKILEVIHVSYPSFKVLSDRFNLPLEEIEELVNQLEKEGKIIRYSDSHAISKQKLSKLVLELLKECAPADLATISREVANKLGLRRSQRCVKTILTELIDKRKVICTMEKFSLSNSEPKEQDENG